MDVKYKVLEKKLSRKDSQISKLEAENLELHEKLEKYIENEEEFGARQRELEAQIKDFNDIYSELSELKSQYKNKLYEFEKLKLEYKDTMKKAVKKIKK